MSLRADAVEQVKRLAKQRSTILKAVEPGRTYELWGITTNNLVEACDTEADALTFVRAYAAQHGRQYALS